MGRLLRLERVVDTAPQWASKLTARNIFTFVIILGLAWFAPLIEDDEITATQAHRAQQILVVTAVVMALAFIARTTYDLHRHRQAKILLANPDHFRAAMEQYKWPGLMFLYTPGITFAGPKTYNRLTPHEKYLLARGFLEHLAKIDQRWWTPINLRRSAVRSIVFMASHTLPILAALLLLKLYAMADACRASRKQI